MSWIRIHKYATNCVLDTLIYAYLATKSVYEPIKEGYLVVKTHQINKKEEIIHLCHRHR